MKSFSKKMYIIGTAILALLICLMIILIFNLTSQKRNVSADTSRVTITVNKVTTVSIYVTGDTVTKKESTLAKDVYEADAQSIITLTCVNESRIFDGWILTEEGSTTESIFENNRISHTLGTTNLNVSTKRRDPTIQDLGKYMDNPFDISEETNILYLQYIFDYEENNKNNDNVTNVVKAYNHFFQNDPEYKTNVIDKESTNDEKIKYINDNKYFNRIQCGYYKIQQSFTILNTEFKGIGSVNKPFCGVFCGSNNSNSSNAQIFCSIDIKESNNDIYAGLFKVLDNEAVIRNLTIKNSIAISNGTNTTGNGSYAGGIGGTSTTQNTIYAGGIAGKINNALLNNLTISTTIDVDTENKNIYAGGIAGTMTGGINDYNDVNFDFSNHTWVLTSKKDTSIYGGIVAGYGNDVYVHKATIDVSKFSINAKNISSNVYSSNTNVYLGNLFGYYENTNTKLIDNILITGNDSEYIQATISAGSSYVGGLIGYVSTSKNNNQLNIGNIQFNIDTTNDNPSSIISESLDANSQTNLYAGGLFAYIDGTNLIATDSFKDGIIKNKVDDKEVNEYRFIFDTPMEITAKQHGIQSNELSYGDSIAGGLVASGYFNINGSSDKNRTELLLTSDKNEFLVQAIQTSSSNHESTKDTNYVSENSLNNNFKHCLASLMFGYLNEGNDDKNNYSYQNINVYANNASVNATREIGSRSLGDVSSSGFLCYAKGRNIQNVTMYLGSNTSIKANCLSYEVGYQGNSGSNRYKSANNVYASAFTSNMIGLENNSATLNNIKINGFDFNNKKEVGTSVQIQGIQNSIAYSNGGCYDYANENYVGGVVGCLKGNCTLDGVYFIGNSAGDSQIVMEGHRNPNSAFVGGIIGFSKLILDDRLEKADQTISNCIIKNAKVIGNATIKEEYAHPDIYAGGIIGACYSDRLYQYDNKANGKLKIQNSKILYTIVNSNGYERIETYAGGVLGTMTWSGTVEITDTYVYKSKISSSVESIQTYTSVNDGVQLAGRAAGIICDNVSSDASVSNSVVIDTEINAYASSNITPGNKRNTCAAGISASGVTVKNCYTNSTLSATHTTKQSANDSITLPLTAGTISNSYYVTYDANKEHALLFTTISFDSPTEKYLFNNYENKNNAFCYTNILDSNEFKPEGFAVTPKASNVTSEAEIWINATESGNSTLPTVFSTEEERINAGWFKLGNVYLVYGSETISGTFDDYNTSYNYNDSYYNYKYDGSNHIFTNQQYPYDSINDLGYEEKSNNPISEKVDNKTYNIYSIDVKLKSGLPTIQVSFSVESKSVYPATYYIKWYKKVNENYVEAEVGNNPLVGYGSYTYTYKKEEQSDNSYVIKYILTYTPNIELENDDTIYAAFTVGSSNEAYASEVFCFDLKANKYQLDGVTLAEYTPALNSSNVTDNYYFLTNTTYRLIPILSRVNEPDKKIISELYCQEVLYSVSEGYSTNILLRSNGELTTGNLLENNKYTILLTLKDDSLKTASITFIVVNRYNVSTKCDGGNISCLPFATSADDYIIDIDVLSHCGGIPTDVSIEIGNNSYDKDDIKNWIYGAKNEWNNNATNYRIIIPYSVISENNGDISISFTFPVNYTIEFHIQTDLFNHDFGKSNPLVLTVKVNQGTTFTDLFGSAITNAINTEYFEDLLNPTKEPNKTITYKMALDAWKNEATKSSYGYLCTGFYLIEDSTSKTAYGQSFDEILEKNIAINTSYVFYARWSFLIELVEAPGTHIMTSFNQDFLYTAKCEEYGDLLNKDITIPINNNRGYVFTIEKDANFVGEADIEAFIVTKSGEQKNITEIPIEKYHDNMYLYYIKPELITGYLVIATKVSNSEIIVGENTSSVMEEVIPEDGIYTFKYVVNHKKDESYIYNLKNDKNLSSLNRDVLLKFDEQSNKFIEGTVIEVYYNKYINASKTSNQTIVGRYQVGENGINKVKLSEFTLMDGTGSPFEGIDFATLLGNYDSVTEVYYFVIIPPNGTTKYEYGNNGVYGEAQVKCISVGYCDENGNYLKGKRNKEDSNLEHQFANKEIVDTLKAYLQYESSEQKGTYTVIPSRTTDLKFNTTNSYHFIDDTEFNVFDINIENGTVNEYNYLVFSNKNNSKTIVTSSKISQGISKLKLNLGYNKGHIKVSVSTDNIDYVTVPILLDDNTYTDYIEVTSELYQDYIIDISNMSNKNGTIYYYFKLEILTTDDIRLSKIEVVTVNDEMSYEMKINKNNVMKITQTLTLPITGDTRHDGKKFILAVQLKDSGGYIAENIDSINDLHVNIEVNGKEYSPIISQGSRVTLYFNLSDILNELGGNSFDFTINISEGYTIHAVQLLEVENAYKPAMGEIRWQIPA